MTVCGRDPRTSTGGGFGDGLQEPRVRKHSSILIRRNSRSRLCEWDTMQFGCALGKNVQFFGFWGLFIRFMPLAFALLQ